MLARRHAEARGQGPSGLAPSVGSLLRAQSWAGSQRQLDKVIRRAFLIGLSEEASVLHRRHVERALAFEQPPDASSLTGTLRLAVAGFVDAVVRAREAEVSVGLDHTSAFRGFVIEAARDHAGSV